MFGDVIGWRSSACGKSGEVKDRDDIVEDSVMRKVNVTVKDHLSDRRDGFARMVLRAHIGSLSGK